MTKERHQLLMSLRVNDVISVNGRLRVVRDIREQMVRKGKRRQKRWFKFDKLRESQYACPTTTYSSVDLGGKAFDIVLVGRNYREKK